MNAPPPVSGPAKPIVALLQSGEAPGAAEAGTARPPRAPTNAAPATASSAASAIPVRLFISPSFMDQDVTTPELLASMRISFPCRGSDESLQGMGHRWSAGGRDPHEPAAREMLRA